MNFTYLVQVINAETSKKVKTIEVIGMRKAEKVRNGLEINMSGDYYTNIVKKENK